MKILILLEITSYGGHVLSAITTGKALEKRGHQVHFACGAGPMMEEIACLFPCHSLTFYYSHAEHQTYFTWKSFRTVRDLLKICSHDNYDHIHAFDARSYIVESILGIFRKGLPVTCTLCGGVAPYFNLPHCEKIIVFSEEQKKKLTHVFGWQEKNVAVISTRLDMEQFENRDSEQVLKLYDKYGINPKAKNILMITNFVNVKVSAIKYVLDTMKVVLQNYSDVNLILIGGRGEFFKEAIKIGQNINALCGRNAVIFTGPILYAQRMIPYSCMVFGTGRGAFEGMAYEKPTLIVGEKGYAGTVNKKNIEKISYYNFSGRNLKKKSEITAMVKEIAKILDDEDYCKGLKKYGKQYLKEQIDIRVGIEKIEDVYKANAHYAGNASTIRKMFEVIIPLVPIMLNNYYSQLVTFFQKNKKRFGIGQ